MIRAHHLARGAAMRGLVLLWLLIGAALIPVSAGAAPFAAVVMDARSGEVLYASNANTRLHPASLTKMLTLYIAFDAISRGEVSLDSMIKVSANAAAQPPSRLGLRTGQKIALRYLIRAAAVKSANDAASAIGDALSGNEAAFAKRMDRTARALGMKNSNFKNANGLTRQGHLSTAYDMTLLGRRLFYDHPEYYNLFSRRTTDAGLATVANTNRRFLDAYPGADGIKTGFTNAAGFNLVASAERGGKRIIATVFGGTSTAQRNAKVAELLDLGFRKAPSDVPVREPARPAPLIADVEAPPTGPVVAEEEEAEAPARVAGLARSLRPAARPQATAPPQELVTAMEGGITDVLGEVQASAAAPPDAALADVPTIATVDAAPEAPVMSLLAAAPVAPVVVATVRPKVLPKPRPDLMQLAAADPQTASTLPAPEVVSRMSTSGGRVWGITIGRYNSPSEAERVLLKTALAESATLSDALRKVVKRPSGFDANFVGMSQDEADLACRRLQARDVQCFTLGP